MSFATCLIVMLTACGAFASFLEFHFDDYRPPYRVELFSHGQHDYVSAKDIAFAFRGTWFWNSDIQKMVLRISDHKIKITIDNPFVVVDDYVHHLPLPPVFHQGSIYLPLIFMYEIMPGVSGSRITADHQHGKLWITTEGVNISNLSIERIDSKTTVIIHTEETLRADLIPSAPESLVVMVEPGKTRPNILEGFNETGFVLDAVVDQRGERSVFRFLLDRMNLSKQLTLKNNPDRIVIVVAERTSLPFAEPSFGEPIPISPEEKILAEREKYSIETVVIDPGHGGKDPGAIGRSGLQEKEVVLDIALRVKEYLENDSNIRCILTRTDDTFIPLQKRTEIANNAGADLFISIHTNAAYSRYPHGFEVFYLSLAKNDEARAVAARENSSLRFEETDFSPESFDDLNFILWDMIQNEFLKESALLAEILQREMDGHLDLENRGVNQAGLYVLNGAFMPAALVETAFISNHHEEELLKKAHFRDKMSRAIASGILNYRQMQEEWNH
jgi:N-acetylmuramoyl-L-alanine amidase